MAGNSCGEVHSFLYSKNRIMGNVIISNNDNYLKILDEFKKGGTSKIHIISDYDRTLTYSTIDGERRPSLISVLRKQNILGDEYTKKAYELFNHYEPIEKNPEIDIETKKREMLDWWTKHLELLIETGLKRENIDQVIYSGIIVLRKGVKNFFEYLKKTDIPLVIISANALGYDSIEKYLEYQGLLSSNIFVESNIFVWNEEGKAIGIGGGIIHVFNKDEKILKENGRIFSKIKDRTNVILLGDSIGDIGMIEGFDYENLLKIGFLNEDVEENIELYKKNYDIIITNDGNFDFVNDLINAIGSFN